MDGMIQKSKRRIRKPHPEQLDGACFSIGTPVRAEFYSAVVLLVVVLLVSSTPPPPPPPDGCGAGVQPIAKTDNKTSTQSLFTGFSFAKKNKLRKRR